MKKRGGLIENEHFIFCEVGCLSCVSDNTASPLTMGTAHSTVKLVHSGQGNCILYIIHNVLQ